MTLTSQSKSFCLGAFVGRRSLCPTFNSANFLAFLKTIVRVRPGPQKPWKSLNFSFQNLRPQKSLNFTKNIRGPRKVLKFSLLCRFHFVWFKVTIVYWKINNEAWSILFSFIPAGCLDLRCTYHWKGLVQQPKLSPIPFSLLNHVEAARMKVSSFTYFNQANGFHSQVMTTKSCY